MESPQGVHYRFSVGMRGAAKPQYGESSGVPLPPFIVWLAWLVPFAVCHSFKFFPILAKLESFASWLVLRVFRAFPSSFYYNRFLGRYGESS